MLNCNERKKRDRGTKCRKLLYLYYILLSYFIITLIFPPILVGVFSLAMPP